MQRWSPEEFAATAPNGGFAPLVGGTVDERAREFRYEFGRDTEGDLLARLSESERERLRAYCVAEAEAALRAREGEHFRRHEESLQTFGQGLAAALEAEAQSVLAILARAAADLALTLAERVVRREVATDPELLARALQDLLMRLRAGAPINVTVHPDDAAWLATQPELCARLRLAEIQSDRRIARGGCLAVADRREWDVTLAGQLAALGEAVEAALAGAPAAEEGSGGAVRPALD